MLDNGFKDRLRELRGNKSILETSKNIGISRHSLSKYEKGIREPGISALYKICRYYCVSADFLLGLKK